jgi:hypothetical protein
MPSPQNTTVRCPQCRQPVQATIYSVVDAGKEPRLKEALLRGQINTINCPNCRYHGALATPMLYHDAAKQLALVLMPMEMGLKREAEEREIGKLTNALIESVPAEQRKMYMLQPRTMFNMERLTDEILEADGITKEMRDKQAVQVRLLETLLQSARTEADFKRVIEEHKAEIDQEFVDVVAAIAQSTVAGGDQQSAAQLLQLAEALAQETGLKSPIPTGPVSADELIAELRNISDDEELRAVVAEARPALDYKFYQTLTGKIEAAQGVEATQLKALREKLLHLTEELDKEMQAALRNSSQILQEILQSPDLKKAIADHLEKIDDSFMMVLQSNIQQAAEQKQEHAQRALQEVYQEVVAQLESRMPPGLKLINQLLRASPGDRAEYLREHAAEITPEVMRTMAGLVNDLNASGRTEVANELRGLMNQAAAWQKPIRATAT